MAEARWHDDPTGRHELRYWDGEKWTDHVSDAGSIGVDAVTAAPTAAVAPAAPSPSRLKRGYTTFRGLPRVVQLAAAGFALLLVVGATAGEKPKTELKVNAAASTAEEGQSVEETTSLAPTTTAAPTTTVAPTTTEAPTTTVAPTTTLPPTTTPPTTAAPRPTTTMPRPTTTIAPKPYVAPATTAVPTASCHPSYQGTCIPPDVSDADCAGGSGNGPYYVKEKNIRVVGPDVFDLDHDGNGIGCES